MPSTVAIINANAARDGWFAFTNDCVETHELLNLIFRLWFHAPSARFSTGIDKDVGFLSGAWAKAMPSMAAIINANAAGDGWFAFTNDCIET